MVLLDSETKSATASGGVPPKAGELRADRGTGTYGIQRGGGEVWGVTACHSGGSEERATDRIPR
jgi:hypothetical protein